MPRVERGMDGAGTFCMLARSTGIGHEHRVESDDRGRSEGAKVVSVHTVSDHNAVNAEARRP
jgi:hypothetical protein